MEFEVKDMSCGACVTTNTNAVTHLDPATKLKTDVTTRIEKVAVLPGENPVDAIEAAGFHPTVHA
ncbi:heavy-metal-associated domain-containing protein [Paraburkholderia fungorum]|uniref:Heavy-metal-associated domain-containing protein n=1 Tax=Paraburkholderia fungorum TaxID=134537 RepID=A0AAP5QDA9_9BURK|nr:heavy metal-associated domain-containing protein [Paraburkholderia fungorum]MDT8840122.1 heavy-metal-associated domain-containing protein [Paraburkholderia fungorum]